MPQIKNSEIRARNAANRQAAISMAADAYSMMSGSISQMRSRAKEMKEGAEAAKIKLVADTPADEVLKLLTFCNIETEITQTGAVKISCICLLKSAAIIFEDVPAVADGSVVAIIRQKGKEIGRTTMIFPMYGIDTLETRIVGIALCTANKEEPVDVEIRYKANGLWLMEK